MRICAIHQPNFFPWLGYFDKIRLADTFVFLDQVDYPKSGNSMGSWCNRVKILVNGTAQWIACPVVRESGPQPIDTVRIDNARPWRDNIRATLEKNYRQAQNFTAGFELLDGLLQFDTDSLAHFNVNAIITLAGRLGCSPQFVRQSRMGQVEGTSTARLTAITKAVNADTYLCGGGARGYQDDAAFAAAGLSLRYQDFKQIEYGPSARYVPGLSIIDWLMHVPSALPSAQRQHLRAASEEHQL